MTKKCISLADRKDVGNRIKTILKERNVSQNRLSMMTGYRQSVISEMLNGKRNVFPLAEYIGRTFGFSMDFLIYGKGEKYLGFGGLLEEGERAVLMDKIGKLYEKQQQLLNEMQNVVYEIGSIRNSLLNSSS